MSRVDGSMWVLRVVGQTAPEDWCVLVAVVEVSEDWEEETQEDDDDWELRTVSPRLAWS
jgi:hypothetical protein